MIPLGTRDISTEHEVFPQRHSLVPCDPESKESTGEPERLDEFLIRKRVVSSPPPRENTFLIAACYSHLDRDTALAHISSRLRACSLLLCIPVLHLLPSSIARATAGISCFFFYLSICRALFSSSFYVPVPYPPGHFATLSGNESQLLEGSDLPRLPYPLCPHQPRVLRPSPTAFRR